MQWQSISNAAAEAHLVIFDRMSGKPWGEKIWCCDEHFNGTPITVWGM
jgi:hypothetical protein